MRLVITTRASLYARRLTPAPGQAGFPSGADDVAAIGEHDVMDRRLGSLLRWWRAQDERFARVEVSWWGAVVSDARYPDVQEANYARVETHQPVRLEEVEARLLPEMARTARGRSHVVVFQPQDQTELIVEASSRGERLAWDLVMVHEGQAPDPTVAVREVTSFDPSFAAVHRASLRWFDVTDPAVLEQLGAIEREVMIPAGRRWFVVGDERPLALAALLVLEDVGCLDHVVTFPEARGRGYATSLTSAAVVAAREAGAERTYLLAEPDGSARRLYERIGFRATAQIASWISAAR
jgi:ribosomal protein S18 acetylase RimI-like enzyme